MTGLDELLGRARISDIVLALGGPEPKRGRCAAWFRGGDNPTALSLDDEKGVWYDHAQGIGGGVLELIAMLTYRDRGGAIDWLREYHGGAVPPIRGTNPTAPPKPADDRDRIARALAIWAETVPIEGTFAARYLSSRGLDPGDDLSHCLRLHPRCPFGEDRHPCMVGLMRDVRTDEPVGVHRTALTPDGRKLDRKMIGRAKGAAVKLTPDAEATMGLGIAEGIETALSVMQSGWGPVWALLSAGGVERFPVLDGIEALTVWADHDDAGLRAARNCAVRWKAAGIEATVRRPKAEGSDYGDAARLEVSR